MKLLFRLFILLPLAIVILLFAVANRHYVTVSFDPFPGNDIAGPAITLPLFMVLTLTSLVGLLAGGFAVWLGQSRYRKAARAARIDAENAKADAAGLRAQLAARSALAPVASNAGTALVTQRNAA